MEERSTDVIDIEMSDDSELIDKITIVLYEGHNIQ